MRLVVPFLVGLLFAVGLGVAGMTLPERVLAFFELRDPGLLLTMGGATAVTLLGFPVVLRRDRPVHAPLRLRSGDTCRLGREPGESVTLVYHEEP